MVADTWVLGAASQVDNNSEITPAEGGKLALVYGFSGTAHADAQLAKLIVDIDASTPGDVLIDIEETKARMEEVQKGGQQCWRSTLGART